MIVITNTEEEVRQALGLHEPDGENWRGPCPVCGGATRFVYFSDKGNVHCQEDACQRKGADMETKLKAAGLTVEREAAPEQGAGPESSRYPSLDADKVFKLGESVNWPRPQFVLVGQDKQPVHRGDWSDPANCPTEQAIRDHLDGGGLLGVVPASMGALVLDGDKAPFGREFGEAGVRRVEEALGCSAAAVFESKRKGGRHIWFRYRGKPVRQVPWKIETSSGESYAGDIRHNGGYIILWQKDADPEGAMKLAEESEYLTEEDVLAFMRGTQPVPKIRECRDWTRLTQPSPWLVDRWLPANRIMMFSGEGGQGKSRIALQLACALASGHQDWIGPGESPIVEHERKRRVVIASWEDSFNDVALRVQAMDYHKTVGNRLSYYDMRKHGGCWGLSKDGIGGLTPTGRALRRACERTGAELLILDPRSAAYPLNENDRGLVRGFMSDWDSWALDTGCAVMLIAHPSRAQKDYSGSTDWHSASRIVWTLTEEPTIPKVKGKSQSEDEKGYAKQLKAIKSNYAVPPRPLWIGGWPKFQSMTAGEAFADLAALRGCAPDPVALVDPAIPDVDLEN